VMIDGPYGGSSVDFGNSENVLMVGGGSGVTFVLGLLDDLLGRVAKERGRGERGDGGGMIRTRKVGFVWCIKTYASILWFADQFSTLSRVASDPSLDLDLSFRVLVTCPCPPSHLPSMHKCEVVQSKVNVPDILHEFIDGLDLDTFGGGLGVAASGPESLTTSVRNAVAGVSLAQVRRLGGVELHTEAYTL